MRIKNWDGKDTGIADSEFVLEDQYGNKWRISDGNENGGWSFQLMFVETVTGASGNVSIVSRSGNIVEVFPV